MMLSSFNFPGKDTRLIRCGSTLYKVTVQSNGNPDRFSEGNLLCDENILQKELQIAVDTVIAMTRRSKLHQFRTDHLVLMPKRKPWKASTLLKFSQHSESLYAHPYILVITVDSCQRYLQNGALPNPDNNNRKRRPDKDLFIAPVPKYPRTSKLKRTPQVGLSTPISVADSRCSSAVSRRGGTLDDALSSLVDDYVNAQKQLERRSCSAFKAQKIISSIAQQMRPLSTRSRGMVTPLSFQGRNSFRDLTMQHPPVMPFEKERSDVGESDSKEYSPLYSHTPAGHRYDLRRRPLDSTPDKSNGVNRRKQGRQHGFPHLGESVSTKQLDSHGTRGIKKPKTRSMKKVPSLESKTQDTGFFSKLLTPFKRLFPH